MYRIKGILFIVGILTAGAASAGNISWDCNVPQTRSTGLVTKHYLFNYDPDKSEASVIDGLIDYEKKGFIPVGKIKDSGEKVVFSWKIRTRATTRPATLSFTASIDRKSGRFNVHAVPLGYDNSENVPGSCKEVPGPLVKK
ncbi:MAG: hypothetical protein ACRCS0_13900 [Albidovulum sp.]